MRNFMVPPCLANGLTALAIGLGVGLTRGSPPVLPTQVVTFTMVLGFGPEVLTPLAIVDSATAPDAFNALRLDIANKVKVSPQDVSVVSIGPTGSGLPFATYTQGEWPNVQGKLRSKRALEGLNDDTRSYSAANFGFHIIGQQDLLAVFNAAYPPGTTVSRAFELLFVSNVNTIFDIPVVNASTSVDVSSVRTIAPSNTPTPTRTRTQPDAGLSPRGLPATRFG
jgi:hypothetical protein